VMPAGIGTLETAGRLPYKKPVRGCSSMVEQKLPKLTTRVRFPSPAPIKSRA
jgi:hypothetical protein